MLKIKHLVAVFTIIFLSGCSMATPKTQDKSNPIDNKPTPVTQDYTDLSACGDFPTSTGDGGPTSRFHVCRDASSGQCYYKKTYQEQISDCDPEFDKYDYGKDECFKSKTAFYSANDNSVQRTENGNDNCAITTQSYFDSKVSK